MNEILWAVTRASALVSAVLLTATFVLGMLTSARVAPSLLGRAVVARVHRTIALVMVTFIAIHVITAIAETYVDIGWISALVPFSSDYARGWIGLGTIAFDIVLAVVVSSLLRDRVPDRAWRAIHLASYAMWPIALVHGVGSVTAGVTATYAVITACALAGLIALAIRITRVPADTDRRRAVEAGRFRVEEHV